MQQAPPTPQPYANANANGTADPSNNSTALAAQDPYVAYPQELSRYDVLFPQYAKDDPSGAQYVHGPEAVALFSKSGADKGALRSIWTMVDTDPVDNRLDQLEFALAMHLIVCVTKKGLPQWWCAAPKFEGAQGSGQGCRKWCSWTDSEWTASRPALSGSAHAVSHATAAGWFDGPADGRARQRSAAHDARDGRRPALPDAWWPATDAGTAPDAAAAADAAAPQHGEQPVGHGRSAAPGRPRRSLHQRRLRGDVGRRAVRRRRWFLRWRIRWQ